MNRKIFHVLILLLCSISVYSQQPQPTPMPSEKPEEWFRVRSDNGEFSIEVPAKYSYFYDKDGFFVSKDSKNYSLKNMQMLNAYHENTLVSVEIYEAKKESLESIFESDKRFPKQAVASSFKRNNTTVYQITIKTDEYHCVRQYFYSKTHIYVLTAGSRNGETATAKHFWDSLFFSSESQESKEDKSVLFSALKQTPVNLITKKKKDEDKKDKIDVNKKEKSDDKISKLIILKKPFSSYTDSARMNSVQGNIQLRLKLDENGYIPEIEVVKSLPEGLMRQTIFAALRIKFLPEEENGKPQTTVKIIEYSFAIY